jgi:hypothetical protein
MAPRKPRKAQPIDQLAGSITQWVSKHKIANNPYLNGLLAAIASKKNLHIWAELNPVEYLPHPQPTFGNSKSRLVRIFTIIRNVLVFSPVALTWAAVGEATSGFSTYIKENGADVVNFLDFWQNGYGVLASEWKIGNVARLDFIIILIVIGLTLYVSQVGHTVDREHFAAEEAIDAERLALAVEIHAALYDKRKITTVTMNASLAGAISRLVSATNNLDDASRFIEKASRKLPKQPAPTSFLDTYNFEDPLNKPKPRKSRRA